MRTHRGCAASDLQINGIKLHQSGWIFPSVSPFKWCCYNGKEIDAHTLNPCWMHFSALFACDLISVGPGFGSNCKVRVHRARWWKNISLGARLMLTTSCLLDIHRIPGNLWFEVSMWFLAAFSSKKISVTCFFLLPPPTQVNFPSQSVTWVLTKQSEPHTEWTRCSRREGGQPIEAVDWFKLWVQ